MSFDASVLDRLGLVAGLALSIKAKSDSMPLQARKTSLPSRSSKLALVNPIRFT